MKENSINHSENNLVLDTAVIEHGMLALPQTACDVFHQFGPGLYVRGVHLPADTFAVGHRQKKSHLNIMLRGKVIMVFDDQTTEVIAAPQVFIGKPGRKMGYIVEDTLWLNVYATEETDINKIEAAYLDKSTAFNQFLDEKMLEERCASEASRYDFKKVLEEFGFTEEEARRQSEHEDDQMPMPIGHRPVFSIRPSQIEGIGVFASAKFLKGQGIGFAKWGNLRTPLGKYVNHSVKPNAKYVQNFEDIVLVATEDIQGCLGGSHGTEITVDYRQTLAWFLNGIQK